MFSFAKKFVDKLEGGTGARLENTASLYFHKSLTANNGGHGLRVLHVDPNSESHVLGLEAWFDFIVGVNGHDLPMKHSYAPNASGFSYSIGNDGTFQYGGAQSAGGSHDDPNSAVDFDLLAQELAMVARGPDRTATFQVWSAKGGITRTVSVELHPAGAEPDENQTNTGTVLLHTGVFRKLGLTVGLLHLSTATHVWKILNTHIDSPAWGAQLVPLTDYIIGCDSAFPSDVPAKDLLASDTHLGANSGVGGEHLLAKTVAAYYERHQATLQDDSVPIVLYVYNQTFDVLRPVTVYLSRGWAPAKNRGLLGCDVGYGLLHRLPEVSGKFTASEQSESKSAAVSERTSVELGARETQDAYGAFAGSSHPNIVDPKFSGGGVPAEIFSQIPHTAAPPGIQTSPPRKSKLSDRYAPAPGSTETPMKQPLEVNSYPADVKEPQLDFLASPIRLVSSHKVNDEPVTEIPLVTSPFELNTDAESANVLEPPAIELDAVTSDFTPAVAEDNLNDHKQTEKREEALEIAEKDSVGDESAMNETQEPAKQSESLAVQPEEVATADESIPTQATNTTEEMPLAPKPTGAPEFTHKIGEEIVQSEIQAPVRTEAEGSATPRETKSIDLLLDDDEDFLDQNEETAPVSGFSQDKLTTQEPPMCDISLDDDLLPRQENEPIDFGKLYSPKSPVTSSQPTVFSPMKVHPSMKPPTEPPHVAPPGAPAGQSLVPPMVKPGRRRKSHAHGNIGSLTDFMNEELSKSKTHDVNFASSGTEDAANGLPPPPPKSLRRS